MLLIFISIIITQIYNSSKNNAKKEYIKVINNLYFQKTVTNIFDNLSPKYLSINHIVAPNESINSILKKYEIDEKELKSFNSVLQSKLKNYTLKVNQKILFTIDKENNRVAKLIFPVSKTKKVLFLRDLNTGKIFFN